MTTQSPRPVYPSFLKQLAKKLKKLHSCDHAKALNLASQQFGYQNWSHYLHHSTKVLPKVMATPPSVSGPLVSQSQFNALDSLSFGAWENAIRHHIVQDEVLAKAILQKTAEESTNQTFRGYAISFLVNEFEVPFENLHPLLKHLDDEGLKIIGQELIENLVQDEVEDYYMNDGYTQVDHFSSHTVIDEVYVGDFDFEFSPHGLKVTGTFSLSTELGYGSRGDYTTSPHTFSGKYEVEVDLDLHARLIHAQIDESSFYGNNRSEEIF